MNILAIDPGPETSGAIVYGKYAKVCAWARGQVPNVLLREMLLSRHINPFQLDALAYERFANQGASTLHDSSVDTMMWTGRFIEAWIQGGGTEDTVLGIRRSEVKSFLGVSGKGADAKVRAAILDLFGGETAAIGTVKNRGPLYGVTSHAWQALGIALVAAEALGEPGRTYPAAGAGALS